MPASSSPDTPARQLLAEVDELLAQASRGTAGLWPRAAALLTRQALEVAIATFWSTVAPGVESCSRKAQLLCLGRYLGDEALAQRAHVIWSALSGGCHYHVYELAPTREELQAWREGVGEVVEQTERAWR
ncbi:MAG: hypothetical protein R2712_26760 [Vicinamibacterales bacterium]